MIQLSKARLSALLKIHRMNSTRRGDMSARSASRQPMRRVLPVSAIESSGPLTAGHRPLALLELEGGVRHGRQDRRLVHDPLIEGGRLEEDDERVVAATQLVELLEVLRALRQKLGGKDHRALVVEDLARGVGEQPVRRVAV